MSTITPTLAEWIPTPLFRMSLERYEEMVKSTIHDRVHLISGSASPPIALPMISAELPSRTFCPELVIDPIVR